jgi:hypothetical protein
MSPFFDLPRDNRVMICVDDQTPPFSFVVVHGVARLVPYRKREITRWATKIAERYMGKKNAKAYGEGTVRRVRYFVQTCKSNCRKRDS